MIRTYVRADLKLDGSWHIGSWDSDAANILGTLKDHKENPVVPGSGIAGMLRAAFGDPGQQDFLVVTQTTPPRMMPGRPLHGGFSGLLPIGRTS